VKWADFLTTSYQALSSQVKTHRVDQEKRARPPLHASLVAVHEDLRRDDEQAEYDHDKSHWSCQPVYIFPEEVAVGHHKMRQLRCGKMEHINCAFSISSPAFKRELLLF
jgi:hypothetical protein